MKRSLLIFAAVLFAGVTSSANANQAPDFFALLDSLQSRQAGAPSIQDIDFSKAKPSIEGYMAAVNRKAEMPVIPFTRLAQEFVNRGNATANASGSTRDDQKPFILVGGYLDTDVSESAGGLITFVVYAVDYDGMIDRVELYFGKQPTGVFLIDDGSQGDFGPGDGVYGIQVPVAPGDIPAGQYLLEAKAFDDEGLESDLFPYVTIHP